MSHTTRIFGPPGTGKTTTLLGIVEKALLDGIPPERIAYVSFSQKAAEEAVKRATKRFGMDSKRFPYFRTLHSLGYRLSGKQQGQKLENSDYLTIADALSVGFTGKMIEEENTFGDELGDQCKRLDELARARLTSLQHEWRKAENRINVDFRIVEQWVDAVNNYKKEKGLYDFTDMLEHYSGSLPVDIFIVDEAQDLSKLQWNVVRQAAANADRIYIAGDDDQCIYEWNGADLASFLQYKVDEDIVLPKSYRVPNSILGLSKTITGRIRVRKEKEWQPKESEGKVHHEPLHYLPVETGNWLLLVRNVRLLKKYEDFLQDKGLLYKRTKGDKQLSIDPDDAAIIYNWQKLKRGERITALQATAITKKIDSRSPRVMGDSFDMARMPILEEHKSSEWYNVFRRGFSPKYAEYIRSCLRNGQKLNDAPRITISTIHKVKGGECDNVAVLPDMSYATYQEANTDAEHRVWYVGVTRAIENLFILEPESDLFYRF